MDKAQLQALKRSINPIALLKEMGMGPHTIDARGKLRAKCWLHGGSNPLSFHGNLERGRFTCHSQQCVVSADIFDVAIAHFGDKNTAFNFIKDFGRIWTPEEREEYEFRIVSSRIDPLFKITEEQVEYYRSQEMTYWLDRGISPTIIERFELGYAPASDRAIFPLRDENGSLYGMQARIADDAWSACGVERYKTYPPGVIKGQHVFGLYQALDLIRWERENLMSPPSRDTFAIVEGNFCVTAAHQCAEQTEGTHAWRPEYEMIGSVMGSSITRHQAALIARHFTNVIVIPDWMPDNGTYAETLVESAKREFDGICTVYRANLPRFATSGDRDLKDLGDHMEYTRNITAIKDLFDRRRYA